MYIVAYVSPSTSQLAVRRLRKASLWSGALIGGVVACGTTSMGARSIRENRGGRASFRPRSRSPPERGERRGRGGGGAASTDGQLAVDPGARRGRGAAHLG